MKSESWLLRVTYGVSLMWSAKAACQTVGKGVTLAWQPVSSDTLARCGRRSMRYQILGPLSLQDEGGSRTISTHKVEKLLAALLIRREQVLSTGQLIAEIWRDAPPLRAMEALYVY